MSSVAITTALEKAVAAETPTLPTTYVNEGSAAGETEPTEPSELPEQRVTIFLAKPDNKENNRSYLQRGYVNVFLRYPKGTGHGPVGVRADQLRDNFYNGRTITAAGGLNVIVDGAPEIGRGRPDGDAWAVPVTINFSCHVIRP